MKKWTVLALVLAMLLSLSAAAYASEGKTVVRVTRWGDVSQQDAERIMVDQFNADAGKNIEIIYDVVPGDGYGDRLITSFSSGEGYDIFASGEGDFYKWVDTSLTYPLDSLIAADSDWNSEMAQSIYDMGNIGGTQYYFVRDYNPICLWYNRDMFDAAGVAYPSSDWTWDDLFAAAEALTVKNDDGTYAQFGFNAQSWTYAVLSYLKSLGLDIVNADCTDVDGYLNSEGVAEALERYVALSVGDNRISPSAADLDTFGNATAMLIDGKLAMTLTGAWVKGDFENSGVNYGTAITPGNHESYLCASAYAIGSRTKNPEAAWEVLKALTGPECTALRVEYTAALPTIDAQLESMREGYGERNQGVLDQLAYAVQPVGVRGKIGGYAATAFNTALERMVFNDGSTMDILNDAVQEVYAAMEE